MVRALAWIMRGMASIPAGATVLSHKSTLTFLLFKVGQAIHNLIDFIVNATLNQCYYNLTKYIFGLQLSPKINKGQAILIGKMMIHILGICNCSHIYLLKNEI